MKKKLFCFIICASSLCACNSENDYEVFGSSSTNETISANSMEYINQEYIPALDEEVVISVDTILYNGISTKENETLTRAIDPVYDGVAQGTPIKTESLKKVWCRQRNLFCRCIYNFWNDNTSCRSQRCDIYSTI